MSAAAKRGRDDGGGPSAEAAAAHDDPFTKRRSISDAIRSEVTRRVEDNDPEVLLDELCARWELESPAATMDAFTRLAFDNFDLDRDADINIGAREEFGLRSLDETIERHEQEAIAVFNALKRADPAGDNASLQHRATKVLEMVFYAKKVVLAAFQARLGVHQLHSSDVRLAEDLDLLLGSWTLRFRWIDQTKSTPLQKLLLHLLDTAMEKRYRKHAGWVYEPIVYDGHETHAWRAVCEIKQFVYASTKKEVCWEQWTNLTASGQNAKLATEHLGASDDHQFPFLRKDRTVFAFRNGVYMAKEDRFHAFESAAAGLSDTVVAAKFFDAEFDTLEDCGDWRDIPTPNMQRIMDHQEWPADVQDWMYILLGRLLYPVGTMDGWQIIPFLLGAAACGKCMSKGTPVLMYDGSLRTVESLAVGDVVMGDDSTPRRVLTLARGTDEMFTLVPVSRGGRALTVTREHVLCLKRVSTQTVVEVTVDEYLALPPGEQRDLVAYRVAVDFSENKQTLPVDSWSLGSWLGEVMGRQRGRPRVTEPTAAELDSYMESIMVNDTLHIPRAFKTGSRETRLALLAGLLGACRGTGGAGFYEIEVPASCKVLAGDVAFVARSLGFGVTVSMRSAEAKMVKVCIFGAGGLEDIVPMVVAPRPGRPKDASPLEWGFNIQPRGTQDYYGFETDGNQRFVLGDFTVTHNSTISLKVAKLFYDHCDVGVVSNNVEKQFGISAFWDKLLFVAPEISASWKMEQCEFQSMVSGESISVAAKFQKAFTTEWTVPGIMAGNEVPSFSDNSGSISRRLLVFSFEKPVVNGDMRLGDKLGAEMPHLLLKCNRAYLEAAGKWGSKNVWNSLPQYFHDTRAEMAQAVNSIEAFLASNDVVLDEDSFIRFKEFRDVWKAFAMSNGYTVANKTITNSIFRTPFERFGLRFTGTETRKYKGENVKDQWIEGVRLADEFEEDTAGALDG